MIDYSHCINYHSYWYTDIIWFNLAACCEIDIVPRVCDSYLMQIWCRSDRLKYEFPHICSDNMITCISFVQAVLSSRNYITTHSDPFNFWVGWSRDPICHEGDEITYLHFGCYVCWCVFFAYLMMYRKLKNIWRLGENS